MSMSSAMAGGVGGMRAQASRLAGISDNIANSATYGYKRVVSEFSNIVISQGGGAYSAGGVKANTFRDVRGEGSLVPSSNPMDIAIQGPGFLPTTTIGDAERGDGTYRMLLTRTGGFKPDASGILRSPTGQVLLGWKADANGKIASPPRESTGSLEPVIIQPSPAASPTRNIELGVNLPADLTIKDETSDATIKPLTYDLEYYGNLGTTEYIKVTFTPKPDAADSTSTSPRSNVWEMTMTDKASGKELANYTLQFGENETIEKTDGDTTTQVPVVYGSLQKVTSKDEAISKYDETTGIATIKLDGGDIAVSLGKLNGEGPLTQISSPFSPTRVTKDGSPAGILTGITIDEGGIVTGSYSSGFVKVLYQVPVVTVPNPDGLKASSSQNYVISRESGPFFLWDAGDGPAGKTLGFAREASTTDIAGELTDMIQAQRAFSSNAKIIQTVDEMMQETANIKR